MFTRLAAIVAILEVRVGLLQVQVGRLQGEKIDLDQDQFQELCNQATMNVLQTLGIPIVDQDFPGPSFDAWLKRQNGESPES